jgi:transposase
MFPDSLLVHEARATVRWVEGKADRRSQWSCALVARRGRNRATVAVANKNARIAWALLATHSVYRVEQATIAA